MSADDIKTINFQIQYFPEDKKNEFKAWAHEAGASSMKEMLLTLIEHKDEITKLIKK